MSERSEQVGELAAALAKAQGEIGTAQKDGSNPAFKGSRYATLASVQAACQSALSAHGIAVVQPVQVDMGEHGAIVTVHTTLMHASGQWCSMAVSFLARDPGPQAVGSCITYGRRYGLAAMAGVAPDDDDDGNAGQGSWQAAKAPQRAPAPPAKPAATRATVNVDTADCTHCNGEVEPGKGWTRDGKTIHDSCRKALAAEREAVGAGK